MQTAIVELNSEDGNSTPAGRAALDSPSHQPSGGVSGVGPPNDDSSDDTTSTLTI